MNQPVSEADLLTRFVRPLEYAARASENREVFLLNYSVDFGTFNALLVDLQKIWLRIARERDKDGKSLVGLYLPASLLIRHSLLAFHALTLYQSFLAWLTFRPGLESLLIIGKWADDPKNAEIWRNHRQNLTKYRKTYERNGLISKSLTHSDKYRQLLTQINAGYLHPNPIFGYRETSISEASPETLVLETPFFDRDRKFHEAHLLAYLHLFAMIVEDCNLLVHTLMGTPYDSYHPHKVFSSQNADRAQKLSKEESSAREVLEALGLWSFQ